MLQGSKSARVERRKKGEHSLLDEAGQEMPGIGVEDTADDVESVGSS